MTFCTYCNIQRSSLVSLTPTAHFFYPSLHCFLKKIFYCWLVTEFQSHLETVLTLLKPLIDWIKMRNDTVHHCCTDRAGVGKWLQYGRTGRNCARDSSSLLTSSDINPLSCRPSLQWNFWLCQKCKTGPVQTMTGKVSLAEDGSNSSLFKSLAV